MHPVLCVTKRSMNGIHPIRQTRCYSPSEKKDPSTRETEKEGTLSGASSQLLQTGIESYVEVRIC